MVILLALASWSEDMSPVQVTQKEETEVRDPTKLIPPIQLGQELTLRLWGFGQVAFLENAQPDGLKLTNLRLLGNLDRKRLGVGFVFNFADLQEPNGNWLRQLYGKVKLTDSLELRVGRLLLSVGNGNAMPGPFKWETVLYPHSLPFAPYGYGVQLRWNNEDWSGIADLTGSSSVPFDDLKSLQSLEFSGRLKRTFHNQERELGYLAGSIQLTQDVYRFGFDGQWQPIKPLTLRGGVFYSGYASKQHSNRFGGFLSGAYRPRWLKDRLELHTMLDATSDLPKEYEEHQKSKDKQGNITYKTVTLRTSDVTQIVWTNGLRLIGRNDFWSVTLDYQLPLGDEKKQGEQFQVRLNLVF